MQSKRVYNFSPGPCTLPQEVLEQAASEMVNFNNTGMSVMEMSHRSPDFAAINDQCRDDIRSFLSVPDNFKIFLFSGGATLQYTAIIQNLIRDDEEGNCKGACYVTTGLWSEQCTNEAKKLLGDNNVNEVAKGEKGFTTIKDPANWEIDEKASYLAFCQNETVHGFQFHDNTEYGFPYYKTKNMVTVCDVSSSIGARPIPWDKMDCVYAGAQKNLGPSGVCVVIVREDLVGHQQKNTPYMMDWDLFDRFPNAHFNTPSTYPIYVLGLNVKHMMRNGGVPHYAALAKKRSSLLYSYIDNSDGYYTNKVDPRYRSEINVPFRVKKASSDQNDLEFFSTELKFIKEAAEEGLVQLKGHVQNPGIRVSMYNAMPIEGVQKLIEFMERFKEENQ